MLLVPILLVVLATSAYGQHQLTIRENGKLCTTWIATTTGQFSLSYTPNSECAGQVGLEQIVNYARICCQAMATTTSSTTFPRECGKQKFQPAKTRIVGGTHAQPNSWPWQVRLEADGGLCGGTLIDTRHVLTAAHCFQTPVVTQNYAVYVGMHDINQPVYSEQKIVAERIFLHEQYNTNTQENDIAIIRLSRPVTISDKINVICLPGAEALNANQTVWITGWGTTSFQGQTSPVLKQTTLHTMPTRCPQIYRNYNSQKQMCAGAHGGGRDTCQGDSGGPLMYESNGQWFLNGVVSYGHECALDGYPGVYARVSYYLPWIRSKISLP
jgi:secreted trypsin-like serine protease